MARQYLVTGGAGFIGSNYAARLIKRGDKVKILDNLSRKGSYKNITWLTETFGSTEFNLIEGDVRDVELVNQIAADVDVIVHLAAQVAVTTSVVEPRKDFEINALGTFNVLEAARASEKKPIFLYASTNKVYGGMESIRMVEDETCYRYAEYPMGISEKMSLDFHSPYGCSKGCGDQYVHDYARLYDLPTVVFRQSCIYGPRQFGVEDQGWLAWFVIAVTTGRSVTIYGDGKQVRDVLHVDDLLDVYDAAIENIEFSRGQVYNIGGGPKNTMSVWKEFGPLLERLMGKAIPVGQGDWRPGDQRIYVSDIRKAEQELKWIPKIGVEEGVSRLYKWVDANRNLFDE
jgi:CDP-paratose 2-epimerase